MYVRPSLLYLFYDKISQIYHMVPEVPYFPIERGMFYCRRSVWSEWTWKFASFFLIHFRAFVCLRFIMTPKKSNGTYKLQLYILYE